MLFLNELLNCHLYWLRLQDHFQKKVLLDAEVRIQKVRIYLTVYKFKKYESKFVKLIFLTRSVRP